MTPEGLSKLISMVIVAAMSVVLTVVVLKQNKHNEEIESGHKATLDSLLRLEKFHITCVHCGKENSGTLFWVRDTLK